MLNVTEIRKHIGLSVVLIGFGNLRSYGSAAKPVFALECLYKQLYRYVRLVTTKTIRGLWCLG